MISEHEPELSLYCVPNSCCEPLSIVVVRMEQKLEDWVFMARILQIQGKHLWILVSTHSCLGHLASGCHYGSMLFQS